MFKDRENCEDNRPSGDYPPADLSHAQAMSGQGAIVRHRIPRISSLTERYEEWQARASHRLSGVDIAPDLARDIGSRRWLRGLATLIGLSAVAIAAWPGFSAVEAAPAMRIDDRVRDEFRSQMIMPLALGADSGRRMGATFAVAELDAVPERPRLDLVATLSQGDSFDRMLRRAGIGVAQATEIAQMISQAIPLDQIEAGTQIDITLGRRPGPDMPRPVDALSFRARFDLQLAVERRGEQLVLEPRPIMVDATPLRVRGKVGESLYRSARAIGAPPSAVQQFLRTVGTELNLNREIGANDEFDMIIDYRRAATGEIEVGDLLYAAIIRDDRPRVQLMRFGREGEFYDASGEGAQRDGLMAPVPGAITSRYGMRRHPVLGYRRMHAGLDFRARTGTPIVAVTDGRVTSAGRAGGCGNAVRLSHAGGLSTRYCHMSRMSVRAGEQVRRGQIIGYAGATGLVTGPHLHYEMYRNGQAIDPASVRFVTRTQLSGTQLANFRDQLVRLQMVEPGAALAELPPDPSMREEPVREIDRIETRQRIS